jgi:hypothetical protein
MNEEQKGADFFPRLSHSEISRLEFAAKVTGGSVERFLLLTILDAIEREEEKAKLREDGS